MSMKPGQISVGSTLNLLYLTHVSSPLEPYRTCLSLLSQGNSRLLPPHLCLTLSHLDQFLPSLKVEAKVPCPVLSLLTGSILQRHLPVLQIMFNFSSNMSRDQGLIMSWWRREYCRAILTVHLFFKWLGVDQRVLCQGSPASHSCGIDLMQQYYCSIFCLLYSLNGRIALLPESLCELLLAPGVCHCKTWLWGRFCKRTLSAFVVF